MSSSVNGQEDTKEKDDQPNTNPSPLPTRVRFQSIIETIPSNLIGARPIQPDQVRPIMRKTSWFEPNSGLNRLQREEHDRQSYMQTLGKGEKMIKFTQKGKGVQTHFQVSKDGSELRWGRLLHRSRIELATVIHIVIGPRTQVFRVAQYDWKVQSPWNCFSLVTQDRSLDIECVSRQQFITWVLGLQSLIPLTFRSLSRAQLNWHRGLFKTVQVAQNCQIPVRDIWHQLVREARDQHPPEHEQTEIVVKSFLESGPNFLVVSGTDKSDRKKK